MANDLFLLWVTSLALVLSPGPANISLASFGVSFGFRPSLPYLVGILIGTLSVLVMVASGSTIVIQAHPGLVRILKALAFAYICYLAWKIATAPIACGDKVVNDTPSVWQGLGVALANPKAFAAIGAVYMGHTVAKDNAYFDAAAKVLVISGAIALSGFLWLSLGSIFSTSLKHQTIGRTVNVSFAILMVVSIGLATRTI